MSFTNKNTGNMSTNYQPNTQADQKKADSDMADLFRHMSEGTAAEQAVKKPEQKYCSLDDREKAVIAAIHCLIDSPEIYMQSKDSRGRVSADRVKEIYKGYNK